MKITCPSCDAIYNIPSDTISEGKKTSANCKKCGGRIVVEVKVETTKRKHPRTKTKNLLSYVGIDDRGNEKEHGMGKALDISVGGILIETRNLIASKDIVLTATFEAKDKTSKIAGKVVYRWAEDSGVFRTGIQFIEDNEETRSFIINMIRDHSKQKTQY
ncbi:MAG: PilZ domain-containing protein [Desulfobacterales bacterium]|nr:MAG: PilZ domain-containing protein [Desulfobacterales bacterium]UCD91390.1 MAG: PilZ domain-containing protein [Desulfobacterales bacterium]